MWCPGAAFKHQARDWKIKVMRLLNVPFDEYLERRVRSSMSIIFHCVTTVQQARGEAAECMATILLDEMHSHDGKEAPFTEGDVRAVLAAMYAGMYPRSPQYEFWTDNLCSWVGNGTPHHIFDTVERSFADTCIDRFDDTIIHPRYDPLPRGPNQGPSRNRCRL